MSFASPPSFRPTLYGRRHMAAAGHPLATMAAFEILEAGGTAVDAGVAAGFALNVVQPDMANFGGVAPILLYRADTGAVTTFAGIGRWPREATLDAVKAAGHGRIPVSPARWVVPAAPAAWLAALGRYGTMTAAEVLAPALRLAAEGFAANYWIIHNLTEASALFAPGTENGAIFCPDGRVPQPGELIRQAALADTFRRMIAAEHRRGGSRADGIEAARDTIYKGEIAERIDRFAREVGAFLRREDLETFGVPERPPVAIDYRGHRVLACGPWCQGPALLQMLAMVEGFDVADRSATTEHLMIEAVKQGLADRNRFYGDPDFVDVPIERLLSTKHADDRRAKIDPEGVAPALPVTAGALSPDTTYACVIDRHGNAFSATPSDSTILVTPMVPGLGFGISDRGLQASLDPADPNCIAPGKRPRLTPNPGLVLGPDTVMPYGTPGGEVQTQAMLQFLVNHIDRGLDLQQAVEAPRWASFATPATEDPHPAEPNALSVEARMDETIVDGLARKGHVITRWPDLAALAGGVCAVKRDMRSGTLSAGADPRRMSYAVGI